MASIEGRPYVFANENQIGQKHHNHRRHTKGHRHKHHEKTKVNPKLLEVMPEYAFLSKRVIFSTKKPILPPVNTLNSEENLEELERVAGDLAEDGEVKVGKSMGQSRAKRFAEELHMEPVCKSISEWVEGTTAEDIWGNTVEVLQKIDIGNTLVNQYFYETYCEVEQTTCTGIDTRSYTSVCSSKHIWAHAKVKTPSGEEGWAIIKVRGSCNCSLFKRTGQQAVVDLFSASVR